VRVAILGFSDLAQSESLPTYRYFKQKGAEITAYYWGQPKIPGDVKKVPIEVGQDISDLADFDLIVHGPAVHPRQIKTQQPVTTLTNIFFEECPTKNIIGVTGTKGKGTTSTLIAKMLEAGGKKVFFGGNVGKPLLDDLSKIKPSDWVVLEMSAAQLIDFKHSPHIGVCVTVVPDHLDWHTDLDEYTVSKQNMFSHQHATDLAVFNARDQGSRDVVSVSLAKKLGYDVPPVGKPPEVKEAAYVEGDTIYFAGQLICPVSDVALLGRHNLENVCAAISAAWEIIDKRPEIVKKVVKEFKGLEHRLEFVRELAGVKYYNDSFSTTPETAIAAIKAFPDNPKIVILGGHDKGAAFEDLAKQVTSGGVKHAIVIGDTALKIEESLHERGFNSITTGLKTMPEMVKAAQTHAEAGDVVLLSPACASFGLFKDYKDRGNQFKQVVQALA